MKKINFENAEIINPAKVTIEGIDYEVTPAQLTVIEKYLSAETLNQMQNNIEESSVAVSPTEPTTNEKVWIQKGKNLLDLRKCNLSNCKLNEDGTVTSYFNKGYYCSIDTTYLNGFLMANRGKNITFSIGEIISDKYTSILIYGTRTDGSTIQEETNKGRECTATIAENFTEITKLELRFNRSDTAFNDTTTIISNLQLEIGSTATEYEAYIEKKINV